MHPLEALLLLIIGLVAAGFATQIICGMFPDRLQLNIERIMFSLFGVGLVLWFVWSVTKIISGAL